MRKLKIIPVFNHHLWRVNAGRVVFVVVDTLRWRKEKIMKYITSPVTVVKLIIKDLPEPWLIDYIND